MRGWINYTKKGCKRFLKLYGVISRMYFKYKRKQSILKYLYYATLYVISERM